MTFFTLFRCSGRSCSLCNDCIIPTLRAQAKLVCERLVQCIVVLAYNGTIPCYIFFFHCDVPLYGCCMDGEPMNSLSEKPFHRPWGVHFQCSGGLVTLRHTKRGVITRVARYPERLIVPLIYERRDVDVRSEFNRGYNRYSGPEEASGSVA